MEDKTKPEPVAASSAPSSQEASKAPQPRKVARLKPGRQCPGIPEIDRSMIFDASDPCVVDNPSAFDVLFDDGSLDPPATLEEWKKRKADQAKKAAEARKRQSEVETVKREHESNRKEVSGSGPEGIPKLG